ncbi:DUF1684 domain-containing protein [Galbibacter sp. PAP.153]|uniref:DUF1684 domain-containing protein n=1 Tax=Galbibacter sp. PAP.153 TaxID=3104623 RepID=UPI0030093064
MDSVKSTVVKIMGISLFLTLTWGCKKAHVDIKTVPSKVTPIKPSDATYIDSITQWKKQRIASLKAADGWLNLAGLYWLEEGENTIGSEKGNTIVFPSEKAAAHIGTYQLNGGVITFSAAGNVDVKEGSKPVKELQVFPVEKTITLSHENLKWYVIKRGDRYAIRLRDLDSELSKNFSGVETFPIAKKWRVRAKFQPEPMHTISITDVTDRTSDQDSPGTLYFTIDGKEFHLDVLNEENRFFIVFGDQTNGDQTYHTGRFLYAEKPDADGHTWLDFNKAYNPPCAFTPYATCPLPPKQNVLSVPVTAGEKQYVAHIDKKH